MPERPTKKARTALDLEAEPDTVADDQSRPKVVDVAGEPVYGIQVGRGAEQCLEDVGYCC
jgi:hypothetical protein